MIITKHYVSWMVLCAAFSTTVHAAASKINDAQQLVRDVGECGGTIVRLVAYDQGDIFGQDERGMHRCFELQDLLDSLNREFEKKRSDLRDRSRNLKSMDMDASDPQQMAKAMKEQSALDIDAKLAQQEYQTRMGTMQTDFLKEVQAAIQELASEFEWDIVIPVDKKSSYVTSKVDVTEKIIKRLNDKYRAKQRAKKFADSSKKA